RVGARQARPTLRLSDSPPAGLGVNTTPAFPDHAWEFRSCATTPRESSRSALRRRVSARSPARSVQRPDPGLHCSNANAAPERTLASGTIGSRPLALLFWPTVAMPNVVPP